MDNCVFQRCAEEQNNFSRIVISFSPFCRVCLVRACYPAPLSCARSVTFAPGLGVLGPLSGEAFEGCLAVLSPSAGTPRCFSHLTSFPCQSPLKVSLVQEQLWGGGQRRLSAHLGSPGLALWRAWYHPHVSRVLRPSLQQGCVWADSLQGTWAGAGHSAHRGRVPTLAPQCVTFGAAPYRGPLPHPHRTFVDISPALQACEEP